MHLQKCLTFGVYIFMGKTGRKNKKYSPEFKICVIMDMREHNLGYHETMRKYFPHLKKTVTNFQKIGNAYS